MYDDYDDYEAICMSHNIKPVDINENFHKHEDEILRKIGFDSKYEYYDSLRKAENRNKKINDILK